MATLAQLQGTEHTKAISTRALPGHTRPLRNREGGGRNACKLNYNQGHHLSVPEDSLPLAGVGCQGSTLAGVQAEGGREGKYLYHWIAMCLSKLGPDP